MFRHALLRSRHLAAQSLLAACLLAVSACDDAQESTDTGDTSAPDAGDTSAPDAGDTAAPDTGDTSAPDVGDTSAPDTVTPPADWEHCPAPADSGDAAWPFVLSIEPDASYCRTYVEQTELSYEYGRKIQLRFAEGVHRLPDTSGTYPFALPACALTVDGEALASDGPGELLVQRTTTGDFDQLWYTITQPVAAATGEPWLLQVELRFEAYLPAGGTNPTAYSLGPYDGSVLAEGSGALAMTLCQGTVCPDDWMERALFNSCVFENAHVVRTLRVDFTGGHVQAELRIGQSMASTEPAILASVAGQLDGASFAQDDYFRLVYSPFHHHFAMNLAVLFDAPLGAACGLQALNVPAFPEDPADTLEVGLIDCGFAPLETRTVSSWTVANVNP